MAVRKPIRTKLSVSKITENSLHCDFQYITEHEHHWAIAPLVCLSLNQQQTLEMKSSLALRRFKRRDFLSWFVSGLNEGTRKWVSSNRSLSMSSGEAEDKANRE